MRSAGLDAAGQLQINPPEPDPEPDPEFRHKLFFLFIFRAADCRRFNRRLDLELESNSRTVWGSHACRIIYSYININIYIKQFCFFFLLKGYVNNTYCRFTASNHGRSRSSSSSLPSLSRDPVLHARPDRSFHWRTSCSFFWIQFSAGTRSAVYLLENEILSCV